MGKRQPAATPSPRVVSRRLCANDARRHSVLQLSSLEHYYLQTIVISDGGEIMSPSTVLVNGHKGQTEIQLLNGQPWAMEDRHGLRHFFNCRI